MSTSVEQELDRICYKYSPLKTETEEQISNKATGLLVSNFQHQNGHNNVPEFIHHYCSLDTGIKILTDKKIWVSSIEKMNDTSETNCFIEIANEYIDECIKSAPNKKELGEDAKFICSNFLRSDYFFRKKFACCFSEDGDLLSQWRAYGDKGHGISLSFATERIKVLRVIPSRPSKGPKVSEASYQHAVRSQSLTLLPSIYDKTIRNKIISEYIDAVFTDEFPMHVMWLLTHFIGCLKHESFYEEQEWRLLHFCDLVRNTYIDPYHKIEYRDSARGIIPFFSLKFGTKERSSCFTDIPIAHITLGPQNETLEEDMRSFLTSVGLPGVTVSKSEIPYKD